MLADLTSPEGGFFTARDADSEGEEGTYYVWTPEQLEAVLGPEDAQFALEMFGLIADGEMAGKVILNLDSVRGQSVPRLDPDLCQTWPRFASRRPKPITG